MISSSRAQHDHSETGRHGPPTIVPVGLGDTHWLVEAGARGWLLNDAGLRWNAWHAQGRVDVVKTGPHRTVYHVRTARQDFYVKHFRTPDVRAVWQNVLRGSKARREWLAALAVARVGLPTFETLALGERRVNGLVRDSFLVTRALTDARPLDQWCTEQFETTPEQLVPQRRVARRFMLARALGQLTARLHLAHIDHADFHAGNVLVRDNGGELHLFLIDLHAARACSHLSVRKRQQSLLQLHQYFAGKTSRADRARFYRAYCETLRGAGAGLPAIEPSVLEGRVARAAEAGWRRADRAWKRGNRHVRRLDHGPVRCRGLAAWPPNVLIGLRDNPEACFDSSVAPPESAPEPLHRVAGVGATSGAKSRDMHERPGAPVPGLPVGPAPATPSLQTPPKLPLEPHVRASIADGPLGGDAADDIIPLFGPVTRLIRWCKQSARRRVAEIEIRTAAGPVRAFVKAVRPLTTWERWFNLARKSVARHIWETGHALLRRGILTPAPILFVDTRRTALGQEYVWTESIPDSQTLAEFFRSSWPDATAAERRAWLALTGTGLASQLRRLHAAGFDHRDLKFSNLLVSRVATDGRCWLLDLDAVRRWPWMPGRRAVQNLARLNVSSLQMSVAATDRLRFLLAYLGPERRPAWKSWWRAIGRRALVKIARNQVTGRPLS